MLSERLSHFAAKFAEYEQSGMQLAPEAVAIFRANLEDAASDARAMEQTSVPPSVLTFQESGNVVRFPGRRS